MTDKLELLRRILEQEGHTEEEAWRTRFAPPTASEVRACCRERVNDVDEATRNLIIMAYQAGCARGHDDTVEGFYDQSVETEDDAALDWLSSLQYERGEEV
jgi:hypothetical protein